MPDAVVVDVTHAVAIGVRDAVAATHTQCVSWLPPQSQSPAGCWRIRTVDLSRPVADAACVVLPDAIIVDVTHAVAIRVRDAVTSADAKDVELVSAASQSPASWHIRIHRSVRARCRCRSVVLSDTIVVDVTYAIAIGVRDAVAPQTPSTSSWLPPQSQSPAGMLAHPHS